VKHDACARVDNSQKQKKKKQKKKKQNRKEKDKRKKWESMCNASTPPVHHKFSHQT